MFEWPKPAEGEIIVPLPFKIFWKTSIPLAAIIGLFMWLISKGEEKGWKKLVPFLGELILKVWRWFCGCFPGPQFRNNGAGSGSSTKPQAGAIVDSQPARDPQKPVSETKTTANGVDGPGKRWLSCLRGHNLQQKSDIESVSVKLPQANTDKGNTPGIQEAPK
jgi:hypothetical protein